ncbi:MAG: ribulose-phosphate 3-epimerase [Candidatus Margulisbacteria bacterium]|nr:ribulose-phosphate 3-epimerase [Candidatus Margulisiibacteriota bacterium]
MIKVAPSILSANFNHLAEDVRKIEKAGADYVHIDVMDGRFVPNITFGPVVIKDLKKATSLPLDVHLMILDPQDYVEEFIKVGADIISIQYEASVHLDRILNLIKEKGAKASLAINPSTNIEVVFPVLSIVDQVLVMTVNPGFAGQKLIPYCINKVKALKKEIEKQKLNIDIEVDGGITEENVKQLTRAGANVLVAGSTVFNSKDIRQTIRNLKKV